MDVHRTFVKAPEMFMRDSKSQHQAGKKTTQMIMQKGKDIVVVISQTPETPWGRSLVSPKPLPGMNITSGVNNCITEQNPSPKSDCLDLLQPNGNIFKDKPSNIICNMLTPKAHT